MDEDNSSKTDRTLGLIVRDRLIPDDPWFLSRMMARIEREVAEAEGKAALSWYFRLKPVVIVLGLLISVTAGAGLGSMISPGGQQEERSLVSGLPASDVSAALFYEVGGSLDESILLLK